MVDQSIYRFKVGAIECIALLEGIVDDPVKVLFENVDLDTVEPELARYGLKKDGIFIYPYTCLLIHTGSQWVLVDTGIGDYAPSCGKLPGCLQEAGVAPKDIDVVVLTHAHGDHIGGNVDKDGVILYPDAQWVMSKDEWKFWTHLENLKDLPPVYTDIIRQQLLPISDRIKLVEGETEIAPGVFTILLPGHTPGHMVVSVRSEGQELLCAADAMAHPLHVEHPEWCCSHWADLDWEGVVKSRRLLYERAVSNHSLVLAFHFDPFPSLGHIQQAGKGWRWAPLELKT